MYLVNSVLALKFVRFLHFWSKHRSRYPFGSITSRCSGNELVLLPRWGGPCESFAHVKINVNKINRLSAMKSFILSWISLLFCLGLVQKVAAFPVPGSQIVGKTRK